MGMNQQAQLPSGLAGGNDFVDSLHFFYFFLVIKGSGYRFWWNCGYIPSFLDTHILFARKRWRDVMVCADEALKGVMLW